MKTNPANDYAITVAWSHDDDCFVARVPAFRGLSADGETPEAAVAEVRIALEAAIDIHNETGRLAMTGPNHNLTKKENQKMDSYVIVIEKSKNNYSACSPDVPGCVTVGDTVEETLRNMGEALRLHLSDEENIPEPKGLEHHLREDAELRDGRFIFAHIPVAEVSPFAHA